LLRSVPKFTNRWKTIRKIRLRSKSYCLTLMEVFWHATQSS